MDDYKKISKCFVEDEPIFTRDIEKLFPNRSRAWIDKTIRIAVETQTIRRYEQGIYYIPRKTLFGVSSLDPQKVILKKYIEDNTEEFGYLGGMALLNAMGLTTQMPNTVTVISNNESSRGRQVRIGNQTVYVMKSPTKVTKENRPTLQLLEAIKNAEPDQLDSTEADNLHRFIRNNNITLRCVSENSRFFPDYVSKRILGGELIDILAQQ